MNDAKILRAIETLHIRFMEAPTERKVRHIQKFIKDSYEDVSSDVWANLLQYWNGAGGTVASKFSPKSLAHLETVADEIFEVAA